MKLPDIVNGLWAITPCMLSEIQGIYATHLRGDKINIPKVEEQLGRKLDNPDQGLDVVDGVAIIPIQGVIGKKMNLMSQISGGCSTEMVARDFMAAMDDPAITSIILHIDSPGGTVDGTKALADLIAGCKGTKPVTALADGLMCSAAFWIGSAADSILMADLTTQVGSIGVVSGHQDISGWEEKNGIKTTEITAGAYKRINSQYAPLTDAGRAVIQADVDYIYSLFIDAVAANRGVSADTVLKNMADGRVFTGTAAQDAGLVDGVATLDQLIARMKDQQPACVTGRVTTPISMETEEIMNLAELKDKHPEIYQAAVADGQTIGATTERERINIIKAQALPGHEALVQKCIEEGVSAGEAATRILAAENTRLSNAAADFQADASKAVDDIDPAGEGETEEQARASVVAAAVISGNARR